MKNQAPTSVASDNELNPEETNSSDLIITRKFGETKEQPDNYSVIWGSSIGSKDTP